MPTIIDELIVLFKLDGSQAKKQAEQATVSTQKVVKATKISAEDQERINRSTEQRGKEREARQEKARKQKERDRKKNIEQRKKEAEEYGDKVKGLALSLSGAFLGFETFKGAINVFNNITAATAALGRKSENLGQAAQDLQTWELAVKKAGGEAEDADKTFSALSQTFTGALLQGKDSPFLQLLYSMGVAARDAKGQIKPLGDVLKDLGDKMQARGLSRANAFNLFTQAGGSEGIFNLLYDKNRDKFLAESRLSANANAQKISESQRFAAGGAAFKERVGATLSDVQGAIVHGILTYKDRAERNFRIGDAKRKYGPVVEETEKKYNLPSGLLDKLIKQESSYDPLAHNKSGATGIAQLMPKLFPGAGKDPAKDIDTAGAELARLIKAYHGDAGLAVAAYNEGQGNINSILKTGVNLRGKPLPQETKDYTKNVYGATPSVLTGAGGNVTGDVDHSVNITTGPVTVQTAATDANGIATDFMGAMRAKGSLVAQSNYGVTP